MNIIFAGTPAFAVPTLSALYEAGENIIAVYTQPDRPAGRGRRLQQSAVKTFALSKQLPVFQPLSLRSEEVQQQLRALQPDLMVVVAYGLILPRAVLTLPTFGCINVHASLLPRWRGAAPIQRAILAGDAETGITIMQMVAGLDTGNILYKINCPIFPKDSAQQLHDRLAPLGADALLTTLAQLKNNALRPVLQNETDATYAGKLTKQEANLQWTNKAIQLHRAIHAFNPFPIAYSYLGNQLVRFWESEVIYQKTNAAPGTILQASVHGIDVATGENILRLARLQLPGGKPLHASELLKARAQLFKPGQCFQYVN